MEESRSGPQANLTLDNYTSAGGIEGVLRKRLAVAQRAAGGADDDLKRLVIPHLATWDEEANPPAAKRLITDEGQLLSGNRADLKPLADALVEARLLTRAGGEGSRSTLEVAHEALLRLPPIADWLADDRQFLVWRDRTAKARAAYDANTRGLLVGRELQIARGWRDGRGNDGEIGTAEVAFIDASIAEDDRRRDEEDTRERQRREAELAAAKAREEAAEERARAARRVARRTFVGLAVAVVLAFVAAVAGGFAWQQRAEATKQATEARSQATRAERSEAATVALRRQTQFTESGLLANAASQLVDDTHRDAGTAMLLTLEALPDKTGGIDRPHVPEAEFQLDRALRASHERAVLAGHGGPVIGAAWSPDGARIVTASFDGTARVWEAATGKELARLEGHGGFVWSAAWSPDGARIVTAASDRTARVWEAATGKELARLEGHGDRVWSAAWSALPPGADGAAVILTASDDKTARLWDAFFSTQDLVNAAKNRMRRCLTPAQREQYFLPEAPPLWCIERRLWPYHTDDWQAWLAAHKAGRDAPMPAAIMPRHHASRSP
jgi:hypothetical protein